MTGLLLQSLDAHQAAMRPRIRRALWALDVVAWLLIIVSGVIILSGRSPATEWVLGTHKDLRAAFGTLWLLGGGAGFTTRVLQLGIAETPAILATLSALVTFELLLVDASTHGFKVGLIAPLAGIAILSLISRLIVLRWLGSRRHALPART